MLLSQYRACSWDTPPGCRYSRTYQRYLWTDESRTKTGWSINDWWKQKWNKRSLVKWCLARFGLLFSIWLATVKEVCGTWFEVIYQTRETVFHHISIMQHREDYRVENRTRSGVFLEKYDVFGNVMKHCFSCLIDFFSIETKLRSTRRNKIVEITTTVTVI